MEDVPEPVAPVPLRESVDRRELEEAFDEEVRRALDELPEAERLALMFQTFGELSYQEISEALDCPLGTVMSRLHRAKSALRRRLADYARGQGIPADKKGQVQA
jgi:RNA polymerase sigma-70 factor (ECF subfamily)